jgi:hypothetical protein
MLAVIFFGLLDPTELDECYPAGSFGRHAGAKIFGDVQFEMASQLGIQFAV